jgi:hypothetical protein
VRPPGPVASRRRTSFLSEAAEGFSEIGASSFVQEVHARIAEAAVLAGDHERALREVEVAERSCESEPPPALRAALDRVRGYAYLQLHEPDAAASEFEKSVEVARASDNAVTSSRSHSGPRRPFAERMKRTAKRSVCWTRWKSALCRTSRPLELGARSRRDRAP